ncbi:MAG: hypothetical protein QOG53_1791 [Frankiales bacterium]|nr:hypothetical protein [Frankiales bacterium]
MLARDATELGWTWDDMHSVILDEGWTRLFRGVYLMPDMGRDTLTHARAVQLVRPKLVASHQLAAAIHGFDLVRPPRMDFTGTDKSRLDVPAGHLYRWALPSSDVVNIDGVLVTSPLRTAVDLMRERDRDTAVIAVDSALRKRIVFLDGIAERLEFLAGERGVKRSWKAFVCLDPKSGSPGESKTRLIMWDLKLYPQAQVPVIDADGNLRYFDFLLEGVVFEPEGAKYHASDEAHEADTQRFNALAITARSCGHDFVRMTYKFIFGDRRAVERLILRTIRARRRRLGRIGTSPLVN